MPERLRMRVRRARARGVLVPQAVQFGGRLQRARFNVRMLGRLAQDLRLDMLLPLRLSAKSRYRSVESRAPEQLTFTAQAYFSLPSLACMQAS